MHTMFWQSKIPHVLESIDFARCPAGPSENRNAKEMDLTVHVNDITLSGEYVLIMQTARKLQQELHTNEYHLANSKRLVML